MFARLVVMQLRPSLATEFPIMFEREIVPLLKKQQGFVDELLLIAPRTKESVSISLWETKSLAESYDRELCPRVEKIMERFIEGVPSVQNFEEKFATFHEMGTLAAV
jgi:hypothetical protein